MKGDVIFRHIRTPFIMNEINEIANWVHRCTTLTMLPPPQQWIFNLLIASVLCVPFLTGCTCT